MYKFECKDLGLDCSFVAKGNTVDEVKKEAMKHAQIVHKDMLAKMSPKELEDLDKTLTRMTH